MQPELGEAYRAMKKQNEHTHSLKDLTAKTRCVTIHSVLNKSTRSFDASYQKKGKDCSHSLYKVVYLARRHTSDAYMSCTACQQSPKNAVKVLFCAFFPL